MMKGWKQMPGETRDEKKTKEKPRRNAMIGQKRPADMVALPQTERSGEGSQKITRSPWVRGVNNPAMDRKDFRIGDKRTVHERKRDKVKKGIGKPFIFNHVP